MLAGSGAVRELLRAPASEEVDPDWTQLQQEGLLGLVASQHLRSGRVLPAAIRTAYIQAVAFEMHCAGLLGRLSAAASARGIPLLVFKGPALAFGAYSHPGQRSFGDIDIAVPKSNLSRFVDLLAELEFLGEDITFLKDGIHIDLHTHPLHQLTEIVGPRSDTWWETAVPLSEKTGSTLRLSYENEFLLALFHGAKHSFSRAGWIVDVALLAQKIEPARLTKLVREYRVGSQLAIAGVCLEQWFGCSLGNGPAVGPGLMSPFQRRFLHLILARRAPDYLGMLSPIPSAHSSGAALKYLWKNLYPKEIPMWQRTKQLAGMLKKLIITNSQSARPEA